MPAVEDPVESTAQSEPMHDAAAILASFDIQALLKGQIEEVIRQQVAAEVQKVNPGNREVLAETRQQPIVNQQKYIKHYRNDVSPNKVIFARTYVKETDSLFRPSEWSTDAKQYKHRDPLEGQTIQFRRGHFFATEQWQVDQLDWMIRNPQYDPHSSADNLKVIGGDPTIYEDDGKSISGCPHCGEPFIPGSNALKAHLRATHGVVVA